MKQKITNEIVKSLFEEGRYYFYNDGTVRRTSDMSYVKMIYITSRKHPGGGNVQFNLYSEKYGVVAVEISQLVKYGTKHGLLKQGNIPM